MSQRCERSGGAVTATFAELQRTMREAMQHEKTEPIQDALSTSSAVIQQRGSELLPLALQLCDPNTASASGKTKKFSFLNATWKLLLTIMTAPTIDLETFQRGASAMAQHLRAGVLSHDWTDAKKNKLATFFASHVVTTVRAHPAFVLASPSLIEELVTLYYAVCVVLATSARADDTLLPLYDNIVSRLHAIFDCLGTAAGTQILTQSKKGESTVANEEAEEAAPPLQAAAPAPASCVAKSPNTTSPDSVLWTMLRACVSQPTAEAVHAEAGSEAESITATSLAAVSAFLHVSLAALRAWLAAPVAPHICRHVSAQLVELLLSWLPVTRTARSAMTTPSTSDGQRLHERVEQIADSLPATLLVAQGGESGAEEAAACAGGDGVAASSPRQLWLATFATALQILLRSPQEAADETHETTPARDDQLLLRVLLLALTTTRFDGLAAVLEAWSEFVVCEDARRRQLATEAAAATTATITTGPQGAMANDGEEEEGAAAANPSDSEDSRKRSWELVHATRAFARLLFQLLCLAEGLLRVRASAQCAVSTDAAATDPCVSMAQWCVQVSTQLCTLVATGCSAVSIQQPPSALVAVSVAARGDNAGPDLSLAVHMADALYEGIAANLESTVRAVPEETASQEWLREVAGVGRGKFMGSPSMTTTTPDVAWQTLQKAIESTVALLSDAPVTEAALLSSPLLSLPALVHQYRHAVAADITTAAATNAAEQQQVRLHADLVSGSGTWRQLTEALQRNATTSTSPAVVSTCRLVAALLLREFAYLPVALHNSGASEAQTATVNRSGPNKRREEVLMVCLRRWLQLSIQNPNRASDSGGAAGDATETEEDDEQRRTASCGVDLIGLEGARSLLSFAEHNTSVSLHDLHLSEVASNALMQLLDHPAEEGESEPARSSSPSPSSLTASARSALLNAWLLPLTSTSTDAAPFSDDEWMTTLRGLGAAPQEKGDEDVEEDEEGDHTGQQRSHRGESGRATRQERSPHCANHEDAAQNATAAPALDPQRCDALLTELQACRQSIAAFLSAQSHQPQTPRPANTNAATTDRARSPLPSQRSFGDVVPHHLRSRRGRGGEGMSPSCSQTPPGAAPDATRSASRPPPSPPPESVAALPAVAHLDSLAAQLQSLVRLGTQALATLNDSGHHATTDAPPVPAVASVVSFDGRDDRQTQPPPPSSLGSPWENSHVTHAHGERGGAELAAGTRTRTVPIMTLSSRSTPQKLQSVPVVDEEADPEVIDVDL